MFILNYPAFIRTAAAVSSRIDQLNEWFSKQQGSIDSQLNNIHKNTRDNLSRNRRRLEELQRQQNEVGNRSTRDENINKLEKMDKNLKLDYKAQLSKQYEKLLDRVDTNIMMVERVTPKDASEAARKEEMLSFFNEMAKKLNNGISQIQRNVNLESAFPMIERKKDFLPENLPDSPSVENYFDKPVDKNKDQDMKFFRDPNKEWLSSQEQEAKTLLDTAEQDIESYVTTYNEIKQEAQEQGFLMGYIERSVKTTEETGLSLVDENGVFSGGSSLMRGLKITPNLLDSFGTVWYNTISAIEPDDDNTWPAMFIFHAEIPYDSIDWKEMHNQYVQTTEAIPGEIYVKKGAPVKIVRLEQISDTEESASYNMPAERKLTVKATFDMDYKVRIAMGVELPVDYQEKLNIYKSQYDLHKQYNTLYRFQEIIRDLEYLAEGDADMWYSLKKFFDKEKGWTPEAVSSLLNDLQSTLHYKDHFPNDYPENEMELNSKYSNKVLSRNTDFEKIAFDLFASLPLTQLKKVAAIYNEINKIASSNEDEKLQYLISSFFSALGEIAPQKTKFSMRSDGALGFWGDNSSSTTRSAKDYGFSIEDEENPMYQESGNYHEPIITNNVDDEFTDYGISAPSTETEQSTGSALTPEDLDEINMEISNSGLTDPKQINELRQRLTYEKEQESQENDLEGSDKALDAMGEKVDYSDKLVDTSIPPELESEVDNLDEASQYNEYLNTLKNQYGKGGVGKQTVDPATLSPDERANRYEQIRELTRRKKLQEGSQEYEKNIPGLAQELTTNRW